MIWGYFALSDGIRRPEMGNPRRLRIMARAPGYLALLGVLLFVVSAVLAPHEWRTRAGSLVSLGGHPLLSRVALDVSETAWLLCGAAAALLVLEVARRATLPLVTLSVGLVTGRVMAGLLWLMTVSATGAQPALWHGRGPNQRRLLHRRVHDRVRLGPRARHPGLRPRGHGDRRHPRQRCWPDARSASLGRSPCEHNPPADAETSACPPVDPRPWPPSVWSLWARWPSPWWLGP